MTREEKCLLAIEKGYTYNPETGKIYGIYGKEINAKHNEGYIVIFVKNDNNRFQLLGHQFAYYFYYNKIVNHIDHINGEKDDNRICNLREVTHQENHFNQTKTKGYTWHKIKNKWLAQIGINYKKIHLGLFDKEEDARAAYLEAKEKYHKINS